MEPGATPVKQDFLPRASGPLNRDVYRARAILFRKGFSSQNDGQAELETELVELTLEHLDAERLVINKIGD